MSENLRGDFFDSHCVNTGNNKERHNDKLWRQYEGPTVCRRERQASWVQPTVSLASTYQQRCRKTPETRYWSTGWTRLCWGSTEAATDQNHPNTNISKQTKQIYTEHTCSWATMQKWHVALHHLQNATAQTGTTRYIISVTILLNEWMNACIYTVPVKQIFRGASTKPNKWFLSFLQTSGKTVMKSAVQRGGCFMWPGPTAKSRRPIVVDVCGMTSVPLSADRNCHLPTTEETGMKQYCAFHTVYSDWNGCNAVVKDATFKFFS